MSIINAITHPHLYGLVQPAPRYLVWLRVGPYGSWQPVGGADSVTEARRVLDRRPGLILPRGDNPNDDDCGD